MKITLYNFMPPEQMIKELEKRDKQLIRLEKLLSLAVEFANTFRDLKDFYQEEEEINE